VFFKFELNEGRGKRLV